MIIIFTEASHISPRFVSRLNLRRVFCYRGVAFRSSQQKARPTWKKTENLIYRGVEATRKA